MKDKKFKGAYPSADLSKGSISSETLAKVVKPGRIAPTKKRK